LSNRFLLGLLLWLSICLATAAAPIFDVSVSSHQIQEQDTLRLILTFKQEADPYGSMISVPEIVLPPLVDFEILGRQTATSTVSVAGKMQMSTQTVYQLRPLRSGQLQIPTLSVPYQEGGQNKEIQSTPIVIDVGGATQSTPQASEMPDNLSNQANPPVPTESPKSSLRQGIIYAAIALVLGSCIYLLLYFLLARQRRQPISHPEQTQSDPVMPVSDSIPLPAAQPHRAAYSKPANRDLESLYQDVRQELEARRLLPYPGASAQEIIVFLQEHKLPSVEIEAVIEFLEKAQALRFQGAPPSPSDLDLLFDLAKKFI